MPHVWDEELPGSKGQWSNLLTIQIGNVYSFCKDDSSTYQPQATNSLGSLSFTTVAWDDRKRTQEAIKVQPPGRGSKVPKDMGDNVTGMRSALQFHRRSRAGETPCTEFYPGTVQLISNSTAEEEEARRYPWFPG